LQAPTVRNNILPFQQVKVGPGLNQGYTSNPTGGYQQYNVQDLAKPKTVDELRTVNKPKVTYDGRMVDGMKGQKRGDIGKVAKNRVETFKENEFDDYFRTTGAYLKPSETPEFNIKDTNRLTTTKEYIGGAIAYDAKARSLDPSVKNTSRHQFGEYGVRNATMNGLGTAEKDDYGKKTIAVYANERDLTTTKVYQGNVNSLIKAIIAPLEDIFRATKKDEMVDNPRHFGNFNAQVPSKPTIYDPNNVARIHETVMGNLKGNEKLTVFNPDAPMRTTTKETTLQEQALGNLKGNEKLTIFDPDEILRTTTKETTLQEQALGNLKGNEKLTIFDPDDIFRTTTKETTLQEQALGNLKGNEKLTIFDPDDVLRTTTKETTLQEQALGNLKGNEKLTIFDPDDVLRTTTKETTLQETINGNLKGANKHTVYDPNNIARTTIKETLIHDTGSGGIITGPKQLFVYDPDEIAKTTIRETTRQIEYNVIGNITKKGTIYDPNDKARTTMKETLIDAQRYGNIDGNEGQGDYKTTEYTAKNINKQFLADYEYYGNAAKDMGEGYTTNEINAPVTQKQFLSDYEYYGNAESSDKKQTSYEDMYNAYISASQEKLLQGREPTKSGKKESVSMCDINMSIKRQKVEIPQERMMANKDKVQNKIPNLSNETLTRSKKDYDNDDRLDPSILKAYLENPYTKPLNSYA
jgi:hypothetical protein